MALPAYRAKQSTTTTGTGTLALAAATATGRSFSAAYGGAARRVQYVISWATGFELGMGDYDGGSPGQVTRSTVLASSNAGALVSLPAGVKDVFAVLQPGQREVLSWTGSSQTATLADIGGIAAYLGSGASTLTLPAVATVVPGASLAVTNGGAGTLTIEANGSELVNGALSIPLAPAESCELVRVGASWQALGLPKGWRQIAASSGAVTVAAFTLPAGWARYRLEVDSATPGAAAVPYVQMSINGGTSYLTGASEYSTAAAYFKPASVLSAGGVGASIVLGESTSTDCMGAVEIVPANNRLSWDWGYGFSGALVRASGHALWATAGVNALRFGFGGGTISFHRARLLAIA